jgi:hypothetical protein
MASMAGQTRKTSLVNIQNATNHAAAMVLAAQTDAIEPRFSTLAAIDGSIMNTSRSARSSG